MTRYTFLAILALALSPLWARAQIPCMDSEFLATILSENNEHLLWQGETLRGKLHVYASPGGGTWTVVYFPRDGVACPRATGRTWQMPKPGEPS